MVTEVERYLHERELDNEWLDGSILVARKSIKRLYALLRIKPNDRAQKILFEDAPPIDSRLLAMKELRKATSPAEQAKAIVENRIPYKTACTIVSAMTPAVLLALVQVMSDQELINNLGSLKKRGAFDNADIKSVIDGRLDKAQTGKRVAAMKTSTARDATNLDEDTKKKLDAVGDAQLKAKGRIKRPTAIIIDKSGSMSVAIEIGKRMASMVSTMMEAPLYVYACDTMAYPVISKEKDLASWERAFKGITSNGSTSCGIGIEMLRRNKQIVEQIVMITDEGENSSPPFLTTLQNYMKDMNIKPHIMFIKCGQAVDMLETRCRNAGIDFDAYTFTGDYYSLPGLASYLLKPSKMDLLLDIMSLPLPKRRVA